MHKACVTRPCLCGIFQTLVQMLKVAGSLCKNRYGLFLHHQQLEFHFYNGVLTMWSIALIVLIILSHDAKSGFLILFPGLAMVSY